ncbi:MAG: isoprenylcysteine carboxylmethyltransferase family protein [Anaerolineae bacterium]|nr:isoprenylcysteine carboxylmethyltransferase family protein [Anaerolineae bacterium]
MEHLRKYLAQLPFYLLVWIAGALTLAQIALLFLMDVPKNETIAQIGVILWWIGAVFGWLPIFVLGRKGGVPKGKSYVHTTQLVETGLYAVVRHPQMGTAWLLMCPSLMLMTQHWASVGLGIPAMAMVYLDLLKADQRLIEKFGDAYRRYMARVPRVNFVAGILRLAWQRIER